MDAPVLTTELESINIMLSLLGEAPVNSLAPPFIADVANCKRILLEVSKATQAEGWQFNEQREYTLTPNVDGEIVLPPNCVSVDVDTDSSVDVVFRAGKLFDLKTNSYTFTGPLVAELTFLFPFDELPETVRQYVLIRAARRLQERYVGSDAQDEFFAGDEVRARVVMCRDQASSADLNILNDPNLAYMTRRWSPRRYRN